MPIEIKDIIKIKKASYLNSQRLLIKEFVRYLCFSIEETDFSNFLKNVFIYSVRQKNIDNLSIKYAVNFILSINVKELNIGNLKYYICATTDSDINAFPPQDDGGYIEEKLISIQKYIKELRDDEFKDKPDNKNMKVKYITIPWVSSVE